MYRARTREEILQGVDEFLDNVTCLPPGEWDPAIRLEPPPSLPSQVLYTFSKLLLFTMMPFEVNTLIEK